MKDYKKGQAALEFLTTYGWAFLVILVMIGALAYFGVLDPSNFVADRCVMGNPLTCEGQNYVILGNETSIQVRNSLNRDLTITNFTYQTAYNDGFVECENPLNDRVSSDPSGAVINRDSRGTLVCEKASAGLQQFTPGSKERVQFVITYHTGDPTFSRTLNGEVYSTVQE
ncbi:MAG: hypothetical protein ACMXX7_01690 [Candidatus Woesearchaeota archaeon]